jgi:hypothetical protein
MICSATVFVGRVSMVARAESGVGVGEGVGVGLGVGDDEAAGDGLAVLSACAI